MRVNTSVPLCRICLKFISIPNVLQLGFRAVSPASNQHRGDNLVTELADQSRAG